MRDEISARMRSASSCVRFISSSDFCLRPQLARHNSTAPRMAARHCHESRTHAAAGILELITRWICHSLSGDAEITSRSPGLGYEARARACIRTHSFVPLVFPSELRPRTRVRFLEPGRTRVAEIVALRRFGADVPHLDCWRRTRPDERAGEAVAGWALLSLSGDLDAILVELVFGEQVLESQFNQHRALDAQGVREARGGTRLQHETRVVFHLGHA